VSFLGASLSPEEVVIVTELMAGGTLWRALKTGKVTFHRRFGTATCTLHSIQLALAAVPLRVPHPWHARPPLPQPPTALGCLLLASPAGA